jgi:hypothetical protein
MPLFAVFDDNGTWTAPAGVTRAVIEVWGDGGGGGPMSGNGGPGGGGGAGGYGKASVVVTPGAVYTRSRSDRGTYPLSK